MGKITTPFSNVFRRMIKEKSPTNKVFECGCWSIEHKSVNSYYPWKVCVCVEPGVFFWLHFYTLLETHQIELHTKNKTFDSKIRFAKTNWWFIFGGIERESVRKSAERSIIYHDPPFVWVCLDHIQIECFNIHAEQQQWNTHFWTWLNLYTLFQSFVRRCA